MIPLRVEFIGGRRGQETTDVREGTRGVTDVDGQEASERHHAPCTHSRAQQKHSKKHWR